MRKSEKICSENFQQLLQSLISLTWSVLRSPNQGSQVSNAVIKSRNLAMHILYSTPSAVHNLGGYHNSVVLQAWDSLPARAEWEAWANLISLLLDWSKGLTLNVPSENLPTAEFDLVSSGLLSRHANQYSTVKAVKWASNKSRLDKHTTALFLLVPFQSLPAVPGHRSPCLDRHLNVISSYKRHPLKFSSNACQN